jgi:hypothetical protein
MTKSSRNKCIAGIGDQLGIPKDARKLLGVVWEAQKFLLERYTFEQDHFTHSLRVVRGLFQYTTKAVIMRASKKESATVVVSREGSKVLFYTS